MQYYKSKGIKDGSVQFVHNGMPLGKGDSPDSVDMEDGDLIDAMLQQTGGSQELMQREKGFQSL